MTTFLHRTDKTLLLSAGLHDLTEPEANYITNPDLSAVTGWPSKYWVIVGDLVTLADPATRAVIDANELEAARDATASELDGLEVLIRAFALTVLDEFNTLRALHALPDRTIAQMKTAVRNKLGS